MSTTFVVGNSIHLLIDLLGLALDVYALRLIQKTALHMYAKWIAWLIVSDVCSNGYRLYYIWMHAGHLLNYPAILIPEAVLSVFVKITQVAAMVIFVRVFASKIQRAALDESGSTVGYQFAAPTQPGVWPPPPA